MGCLAQKTGGCELFLAEAVRLQEDLPSEGTMPLTYAQDLNAPVIPISSIDRQKLLSVIETMAVELERLTEDNKQLQAAVTIYRELLVRYTGAPAPPA